MAASSCWSWTWITRCSTPRAPPKCAAPATRLPAALLSAGPVRVLEEDTPAGLSSGRVLRRPPGGTRSRCAAGGRGGARAAGGAAGGGGGVRRAGQPAPPAAPQPVDQAAAGRARVPGGRARAFRAAHLHARRGLVCARHGRPARPGRPPICRAHPLAGAPRRLLQMSRLHCMRACKDTRCPCCPAHAQRVAARHPAASPRFCAHPGASRGRPVWAALAGVTEWGRRSQADSRQRHVKDLGVVLGAEAAVIIVDDTAGVWPQHAANLLTVWPRSRTPCACPWHETPCRQRGSLLPSSPHSAKLGTITCPCSDAAEAVSATRHASEPRRG